MMTDKVRKSPVRLSDEEEYMVYKYCIENHGVYQIDSATEFRVEPIKIANEINLLKFINGKQINSHHVRMSVERVVAWQKRMNKLPAVPIETAELEQLRIYKTKTTKEIEEYKLSEKFNTDKIHDMHKEIERLKKSDAQNKIDRIRAIVSA